MKKRIMAFFTMLLMMVACVAPSFRLYAAEEDGTLKEAYFADIEEGDIFLVYAEWENSVPTIKFRSPSGDIYDISESREGTHLSMGDGMLYYQIEDPEVGEWYVLYDKKDNDTISIDLEDVTRPLVVKDITVSDITGYDALVSFRAEYQDYIAINYRISVTAGKGDTGEVIYEGSAYTNEDVSERVDLSRFGSYDAYKVYVYVYFDKNGGEIGEGAYSETFSFSNSNVSEMQTPVSLTLIPDDFMVKVNLEKSYRYSYLVAYYTDNKTEPDFFMEIGENDNKSFDYVYDVKATVLRVEISEKTAYGAYSLPKKYTIDLNKIPKITYDATELTNKRFIAYSYSGFEPKTTITIAVNNSKGEYILNAAEGSMTAALNDTFNTVSVSFTHDKDVTVVYNTEIYMDIEAPRIYMLQDYTDVKTSGKSYSVLGTVTGADSFTIGGKEVTLNSDGTFAQELELKKGENVFVAEAKDLAGNITVYTISITSANAAPTPTPMPGNNGEGSSGTGAATHTGAGFLSFLPAVIAAVLGIALVVVVIVLGRKSKPDTILGNIRKVVLFLGILGIIFTGYSTYNFVSNNLFVNSPKYIDLAYESIDKAGEYLKQLAFWKKMTIAGAVEIGVSLVAFVVTIVLSRIKSKNK